MKYLFTLLLSFYLIEASQAQKLNKTIAKYVNQAYPKNGPGGAILVSKKGEIIYHKAFGLADIENKVKNEPHYTYKIGSISKQYTAVCILMLQEEDKLNVNDPIHKHLPQLPDYGITIKQLLNHTSGIPNYTNMADWPIENWNQEKTPQQMVDLFKDKPLDFKPGTDFSYSNSGYVLLGMLIEQVSGLPYATFINERIFKTVGMDHSFYGEEIPDGITMAKGYTASGENQYETARVMHMSQAYAAGGLVSSVHDQFKWISALRDNKLISAQLIEQAWQPEPLPNGEETYYAYGWMRNEIKGSTSIEHGGGIFGFVSTGIYLPEEDIFVSILTNRDGKTPEGVAIKVAAAVMNNPYETESQLELTPEELDEYVAVYDFEDDYSRTITRDGNNLYSQRIGGGKIKLIAMAPDQFVFEGSETKSLIFTRNNMNQPSQVVYKNRISQTTGMRTNKKIVEREEVTLPVDKLKRLQGKYELAPNFIMTITQRNGRLFAQATGQPEIELFALNELRFFIKVVQAEIEFTVDQDGTINQLTLFQNGQEIPGKRVD